MLTETRINIRFTKNMIVCKCVCARARLFIYVRINTLLMGKQHRIKTKMTYFEIGTKLKIETKNTDMY